MCCIFTVEVNHTTTTLASVNTDLQEKIDELQEGGQSWPHIPEEKDTNIHSSLSSTTHLPTPLAPITPSQHNTQVSTEMPVVLTPTTLKQSTTPVNVDSKNSPQKPSDNQTTLWHEIGLPRKPSISANKSILVTNDSAKGEHFVTTDGDLIQDPTGYSTEGDTQTGSHIYHHGNNGDNKPLNSHQESSATSDALDYLDSTSPISSVFDSDLRDRTHIQSGIDPGGLEEKQNRSSNSTGVTSDSRYEPDGAQVHKNESMVRGISNKKDKQNTGESKGHVEKTVNGVRFIGIL